MERLKLAVLLLAAILVSGCSSKNEHLTEDGRTIVSFWVKWEGFERAALESLVSEYNESQNKAFVKTLSVSDPKRKVMLATANGHPPDIAILYYFVIPAYSENNALTPLNKLYQEYGISLDDFLPSCQDAITHRGFTWGIPTTTTATALHYNKRILREAGISMDTPPQSIEELEEINDLLTRRSEKSGIEQMGFLPLEPDWWLSEWGYWFGGEVSDESKMLIDQEPWNQSATWLASYPERFGSDALMRFKSGFGGFASSQNPFFTEKVAMVHQGMWMENFIQNYAPEDFEYGVVPLPATEKADVPFVSIVEPDTICIPRGAKHIPEAMDFIKFLIQRDNLEQLALEQRKLTSLKSVSEDFIKNHPHPHIEAFQKLAASPFGKARPLLTHYENYQSDLRTAYESIFYGRSTPQDAFDKASKAQNETFEKGRRRWDRISAARSKEWSEE